MLAPFEITVALLGGFILLTAACLSAGAVVIAYRSTHPPRRPQRQTPECFGATFEEITFCAPDGVRLSGWYVPCRPERSARGLVILCHGMSAHREEVLPEAACLRKAGFAVLLFDFRALGKSGGEICTGGYLETQDLRAAVDYAASRPDTASLPIGLFGFSMGGVVAIQAAENDPRIRAVATHGAFSSLDRAISMRCRHHFGPLAGPVDLGVRALGRRSGWFLASPSVVAPIQVVARLSPRPLLMLHGERDPIVRLEDSRALYAAAKEPKSLIVLPRSGHRDIHPAIQAEAQERLVCFFLQALCPEITESEDASFDGLAC